MDSPNSTLQMRLTEKLPGNRKLVDAAADWLCSRVRRAASSAPSLSQLLVVVPTAQSGRQLRFALASRAAALGWGGILPPDIRLPMQLVVPADESLPTASRYQLRAAFLRFLSERNVAGEPDPAASWPHLFRPGTLEDISSALSVLDQFCDIWTVLSGGGLLMGDVPGHPAAREVLAAAQGDESVRWEELAAFEEAFFSFLHARGLRAEPESIRLARLAPRALPADIEEVVLPGLADPVGVLYGVLERQRPDLRVTVLVHGPDADAAKVDEWGRPDIAAWTGPEWVNGAWKGPPRPLLSLLRDEDIVLAATDGDLAQAVARDFPSAEGTQALPSLGLCDSALYPELEAAFLEAGCELHNPEEHHLASTSLGRIALNLLSCHRELPWDAFAALVREEEVLSPLLLSMPKNGRPQRAEVLAGLDIVRNAYLPRMVPAGGDFGPSRLQSFEVLPAGAFCKAARVFLALLADARSASSSAAGFVREALVRLFARHTIDAYGEDREFVPAAEALRRVLNEAEDAADISGLSAAAQEELLRKSLAEAVCTREPDAKNAIRTEGWLELAWSPADKIALAGFHEGAVPESVLGHPFLPDSLRVALGLPGNRQRLARDTYLLASILASRAAEPGAVRAYVALAAADGELHRPSRLLFLVDDAALPARAKRLFGEAPPRDVLPPRSIAPAWRPALPDEVPPPGKTAERPEGVFSASAIDTWLKCPFTYLFSYGLGMRRIEEKEELEANDFGTFVHKALEVYALRQLERTGKGLPQLSDEKEIAAELSEIVKELVAAFGAHPGLSTHLQLDAAAGRLACFARIQAMWAKEGWRVALPPEYRILTRPFAKDGLRDVLVKGSVDRIDCRDLDDGRREYRLIDYKTWDRRSGAWRRILKGGEEAEHARMLGLPMEDSKRLLTIQLPLYGRCLEVQEPSVFLDEHGESLIADWCYLLLGQTPSDVCVLGSRCPQGEFEAERKNKSALADYVTLALETAETAVSRIRANVFWPPGPSELWRYDVRELLASSPEKDFPPGTAWRDAQEDKLFGRANNGKAET